MLLRTDRAAVKFERKTRLDNLELSRVLEGKINSMQQEIEMLRAELSNAEKRARAAAAAASNPSMKFPAFHFMCLLMQLMHLYPWVVSAFSN